MKKELIKEYREITNNIINNETFKKTKNDFHHGTSKYDHLIRVSKCSFILGKLFRANIKSVTISGLLHDFFFGTRKAKKEKVSTTISESAKETNFNYITQSFNSINSNISESYNSYLQTDYIFDTNFFTQKLNTFSCLSFLSTGKEIIPPQKIKLIPYFVIDRDM